MRRISLILALFFPSLLLADDPAQDLSKAKEAHTKELARLRDKLLADIDAVIKAEADAGRGIDYLLKDRKGFAENGVLPILPKLVPASRQYTSGKQAADAKLARAYNAAITAHIGNADLDKAAKLRAELKAFRDSIQPKAGTAGSTGTNDGVDSTPVQSLAAKEAIADYKASLKKLEEEHAKKIAALRAACIKELDEARAVALDKKDLAEAQRIVALQKELEQGSGTGGELEIVTAWFGYHDTWRDVTPTVKKLVKDNGLSIPQAWHANAGFPDPAFGQHKSLIVVYRRNGVLGVVTAGDDKPLVVPPSR